QNAGWDPSARITPPLDIGDDATRDGYLVMLIGHPGEVPIAETRFGTVGAEVTSGYGDPASYSVYLAHRIAAGDTDFHVPKIPPQGNTLESWARDHLGPALLKDLEDMGILPRRENWHAAPGNGMSAQASDHK
ncbi:MAG: hypothetical protein ACPLRM_03305, partial [Anaerolineae bacterium]